MNTILMVNQILRWLMQPKVWRLLCFASSVVGLICYALSSSFNDLLGKWTWWKILVYIIFSFFICFTFLLTTPRQRSTSIPLESHLAFLVLIITSIYSFFYDKVVHGKPDAYSLISCASFAIMSVGLSRLTQFGFEIDLLFFFCGGFTVQLMKIKICLAIIGGSFSYFLIILRSSLDTPSQQQHQQSQVSNHVTIQIDSEEVRPEDGDGTVNRDAQVVTQSNSYSEEDNGDDGLIRLQLVDFIKGLEKENQKLVLTVSGHVYRYLNVDSKSKDEDQITVSPDVNLVMDTLPSGIITRLRETVKLMMEAGLEKECYNVYSNWRREFVAQCLTALGLQFQTPMSEDVEKWIKACKAAQKILFPNERRLCDSVFSEFPIAADVAFIKVCKEVTIRILSFADTIITSGNYLSNHFFTSIHKIKDSLHELSRELIPHTSYRHSLWLVDDVKEVRNRFRVLMELVSLVYHITAQATVAGGGLHLITQKVMVYIHNICASNVSEYYKIIPVRKRKTSFSLLIERMIELLESTLETKSRDYTDPALGYLFMINNLTYIRQKASKFTFSSHRTKLDDDWFRENTAKVEQRCKLYQRSSWNKMLDLLTLETNESAASNVVVESMKDKLNLFNRHFEKTCEVQSTWIVSDNKLREQIIKSIDNLLLPAYGEFIGRFQDVLGKRAYKYIKYGIVDIQNYLSNLFLLRE